MKPVHTLVLFSLFFAFSCTKDTTENADKILYNGNFWTVDPSLPKAKALAVKNSKIMAIGTLEDLQNLQNEETEMIDLNGQFAMPGFIEGHGHLSGFGKSLIQLNFLDSKSWEEVVEAVAKAAEEAEDGEWIEGRGWHQEKWTTKPQRQVLGYPYHDELSRVSPNNPVVLRHASGHSLFANQAAMEAAGISVETQSPSGGEIVRGTNGQAIGVFEERAMALIYDAYDDYLSNLSQEDLEKEWYKGIELAQKECLANGVTSFQDAGTTYTELDKYTRMAENGELDIRLWSMLRHSYDRMNGNMQNLPVVNAGNGFFTCKAIKSEVDGALGAFGAWLLKPYNDKKDFYGQNTTSIQEVKNIAKLAYSNDMQLCVHAIGDRANKVVLDIFEDFTNKDQNRELRWRVEHAQHLDTLDIPRFRDLRVIASMQGIHCTSDAPFVESRLGYTRSQRGAYAWRSLLDEGVLIANGTDVPVEKISPIECYYASVTRSRSDNGFSFFPEQRMTREEAIASYTLSNAFAAFEEDTKGSLTVGKYADIVVLSKDLIQCSDEEILDTEVLLTLVGGEVKYRSE